MSENKPECGQDNVSRRKYLETIVGSGGLLAGISTVTRAQNVGLDHVHEQALKIRNKVGGKEGQERFLNQFEKEGIGYRNVRNKYNLSSNTDVSSERYFEDQLNVDITISYDCNNSDQVWLDTYWWFEYTCASSGHGGVGPDDIIAMHWSSNSYNRIDDTEYTSKNVYVGGGKGDLDSNGIAVEYDDYKDWYESLNYENCSSPFAYFGTKAWIDDPSDPVSSRLVAGDYYHTYTSCNIGVISVGTGGLSVGGDCDAESMDITYDEGEENDVDCWDSGR